MPTPATAPDKSYSNIEAVTDQTLNEKVLKSDKPVLLYFWGDNCPPCVRVGPMIEALAKSRSDFKTYKVNADETLVHDTLNSRGGKGEISQMPTLVLVRGGKHEVIATGEITKVQLDKILAEKLPKLALNTLKTAETV